VCFNFYEKYSAKTRKPVRITVCEICYNAQTSGRICWFHSMASEIKKIILLQEPHFTCGFSSVKQVSGNVNKLIFFSCLLPLFALCQVLLVLFLFLVCYWLLVWKSRWRDSQYIIERWKHSDVNCKLINANFRTHDPAVTSCPFHVLRRKWWDGVLLLLIKPHVMKFWNRVI
jgi:hypothetical protein